MGFTLIAGPFGGLDHAWREARRVVHGAAAPEAPLTMIGEFVVAPAGGPQSRDFQTLHFDFGLPYGPSPIYGITRSARLSTSGGIVMPMSRAVLRFTISS